LPDDRADCSPRGHGEDGKNDDPLPFSGHLHTNSSAHKEKISEQRLFEQRFV
jgi:hypothetical protein